MPKVPRAKFPFGITNDYYNNVRAMLLKVHENVLTRLGNQIAGLRKDSAASIIRKDEDLVNVTILLDNLREETFQFYFTDESVDDAVLGFIDGVQAFTDNQFAGQVKSVLGLTPLTRNEQINAIAKAAVRENVSYVRSIPSQYHDKLETAILQGLRRGKSTGEIADEIQRIYEVSRDRARFLARDQAGSLMTDITKARHESQGLEYFIWRTAGDGVVRDAHADLEGKRFKWSEGANGLLPGEDYGCRCVGEVDVDELMEFK